MAAPPNPTQPPAGEPAPPTLREWLEDLIEIPMALLSLGFVALIVVELSVRLSPSAYRAVIFAEWVIWGLFVLHFVVFFSLAPRKLAYLRRNWLVLVSLALPFFRFLLIFRALRALRLLRAVRAASATGRVFRRLSHLLQARRIVLAALILVVVVPVSATIIFVIERDVPGSRITTYGLALWFATRSVMNADVPIYPLTAEGRVVGVLISIVGVVVFGVVTAALASYFVSADREADEEAGAGPAGRQEGG